MNDNANYSASSNEAMVVISDAALANKQEECVGSEYVNVYLRVHGLSVCVKYFI